MIKLILDEKELHAPAGVRLLDWAREQGATIPSLCGDNQTDKKTPCDLCVVEINGEIVRSCEYHVTDAVTVVSHSEALTLRRQQALTRILSDHHADCEAPCKTACPAAVDIQSYLFHIAQGDEVKANEIVKQSLPMPMSVGRVCPAFCETECRRNLVDEPLAIRQLKRHAADIDLNGEQPHLAPIKAKNGKRVAIIGAGPAGLSAGYFLSHQGVEVDLFESMPEAGGWLRYGIPEYRLPKQTLAKEIELMCRAGMKIHTNKAMGKDLQLADLQQQYDGVCLAIGAQQAVDMPYTGSDLDGVLLGVDYLKAFSAGEPVSVGKKVAVVGGGNTAIDCARTALRQGADVTIIYRRTKADMPAEDYEIHEAEVEGIDFMFMSVPVENVADENGRIAKVKVEALKLGEPDASGRRRPESTGEFSWHEFDTVIPAVSQKPDTSALGDAIALTRWNTADAPDSTFHTGGNTFAIGDFRLGPATAVEAIGEGRRCAEVMLNFFNQGKIAVADREFNSRKAERLKDVESRYYGDVPVAARLKMPELAVNARTSTFGEVETGFDRDLAIAEAARCLECGCQKSQSCDLRDYATEYRINDDDLGKDHYSKYAVDESSPFIRFDANRCIGCGQCVQACRDEGVHNVLDLADNGQRCKVKIGNGELLSASDCVQCGACVQACPVGAITEKNVSQHGLANNYKQVNTVCTYCGVGCGITMHVDENTNKVVKVSGVEGSPVNQGMLCVKGRFGFDFVNSEQRLTQPYIRVNGELQPASWDDAISLIAKRFTELKTEFGSGALAGLSSAKTTNEENYLFQKFIRTVVGNNNVDHCARLCHATTGTGLEPTIGNGSMTNNIASIKHSELVFIIGSDTATSHPVIASHIRQATLNGNAKLVVADPRKVDMAFHSDLYLQHRPGTDVMLLNALAQEIIRNGWQDQAFIDGRTEQYDALYDEVMRSQYSVENAAIVCGVDVAGIKQLAKMIGASKATSVFYAMGITQHSNGTNNVKAISNLQLLTGNVGKLGAGINPLRGQSNVQGAGDMGALPNTLPGHFKLPNEATVAHFKAHWGVEIDNQVGLKLTEMIDAILTKQLRSMYIVGENPVLSDPDQVHVLEALNSIDFLVVQDIFMTETAQLADVVLPAFSFAEKTGHITNTERRVQRLRPAIKGPGLAKPDWQITQLVANAMGADWNYQSSQQILEEINSVAPVYAGITWQRTETEALQWPCYSESDMGTPIMHEVGFFQMDKANFAPVPYRTSAELPDEQYPLILTTGRQLAQFHTGTMTRKTAGMDELAQPMVMVSVADAERMGISNSQMLKLTTRRGELEVPAFVTKRIRPGVVFMPFHFVEAAANVLTNAALDPIAKIPEFKVCAVKVEAA
ncbi:formate dehydrogenase subunit alpha [Ferrimonas lipolytica]|uniref:Formate dehydrogenase subunit alpha n=1 Tax=Ferrimonas lipolytica TaxID=2724191 RepID=A0A6H1UDP1_9GAMM|nr:formate dehydrogenase subunit alpha [Ferrimonas lipolytica]QIZ76453.1 formate dehydrogenase subunit alpha [Ferrimonas lipolytica]